MVLSAKKAFPHEACGVIAGKNQTSQQIIPITNILDSPTAYRMDPGELVDTFWELDQNGLDAIAFFHSHPESPPIPSLTDLNLHFYPEIPQVIIGRVAESWIMKAYILLTNDFEELPIIIT